MNGIKPKPSAEREATLRKTMEEQLKVIEEIWLKDTHFVTGNELRVSDLFGASEIEQTSNE